MRGFNLGSLKVTTIIRALLLTFAVGTAIELVAPQSAEARAGRGRSSGRSSSFSRPSTPNNQQGAFGANRNQPNDMAMNQNRGGFMRGMAGGLAGGFLGSMLFSSLGHAGTGLGGGSGGLGLLEILLFAGLAYFGYRWWKGRQQRPAYGGIGSPSDRFGMNRSFDTQPQDNGRGMGVPAFAVPGMAVPALAPVAMEADAASDIFFKIQGAWTRRELAHVQTLLTPDMYSTLGRDLNDLKTARQINRLENISVRRVEVLSSWHEDGIDYTGVRFTANLLDYTVEEASGRVIEGSDVEPVKFEEDWTFAKVGNGWQLAGIQQV